MAEKIQPVPKGLNKVVARYRDGRMVKGVTHDFGPQKKSFHVVSPDDGKKVSEIAYSDLKAIFFVKSFEGRKQRPSLKGLLEKDEEESPGMMKVKIIFTDGEVLYGTTQGYSLDREGFFVVPSERESNNLRIFVISKAVKLIESGK